MLTGPRGKMEREETPMPTRARACPLVPPFLVLIGILGFVRAEPIAALPRAVDAGGRTWSYEYETIPLSGDFQHISLYTARKKGFLWIRRGFLGVMDYPPVEFSLRARIP